MHSLPAASVATAAARAATLRPAAAKLLICMNYRRVECSVSIAPHVIRKITLKTCFAEKTAGQNFHEWDEHVPVN